MTVILIEDEQRCNFCVYWTGMRKKAEDFVYIDLDTAEWGICLHSKSVTYNKPEVSCAGCSECKNSKNMLYIDSTYSSRFSR